MRITLTKTRFAGLGVRTYTAVTRVGVYDIKGPFQDTWTRFVDLSDDADIGPSFPTKSEALAYAPRFAEERGYPSQNV